MKTRRSCLNYFFGEEKPKECFGYNNHIFDIDTSILLDYHDWLKNLDTVSIQTRKNKWVILRSFLQYIMEYYNAKGYKFIVVIPNKTVDWNGYVPKKTEVYTNKNVIATREEIEQILTFLKRGNTKHYLIFRLFAETGMRRGELRKAKYVNVNFEYRHIKIDHGKTGLKYYVFSNDFVRFLKLQVRSRESAEDDYPYLFLTRWGKPYGNRMFNLILKQTREKLGIEKRITTHTFRRTLNTLRKKELKCPNNNAKRLVGHKLGDVNEESYTIYDFQDLVELYDEYNPYQNLKI